VRRPRPLPIINRRRSGLFPLGVMRNQDMPPSLREEGEEEIERVRRQAPPQVPKTAVEEMADLQKSLAGRFDVWAKTAIDPHQIIVSVKFLKGSHRKIISSRTTTYKDLVASISDAIADLQTDEYFDLANEPPLFELAPDEVNPKRTEEYLNVRLPPGSRLSLHKSVWELLSVELGQGTFSNQDLKMQEATAEMWELSNASPHSSHTFRAKKLSIRFKRSKTKASYLLSKSGDRLQTESGKSRLLSKPQRLASEN